jgi:hypothetical protein
MALTACGGQLTVIHRTGTDVCRKHEAVGFEDVVGDSAAVVAAHAPDAARRMF